MQKSGEASEVCVETEIGKLEKVIIHSPGKEIQDMTPRMAEKLLYNDIIPLSVVSEEHSRFKRILQRVSEVYEITDLLAESLLDEDVRGQFISRIVEVNGIENRREELLAMSCGKLVETMVTGLKMKKSSLEQYLSDKIYDINPLPNLYFSRDAAMVYGSSIISGAMANRVRQAEAEAAAAVFINHPDFKNSGFLFEGHKRGGSGLTIEGGDFIVLSKDCLLIGLSERTNAAAVDLIARELGSRQKVTVFACVLPRERATIHLDMILTQIDEDELMVYEPFICGSRKIRIVRIDAEPGREPVITDVEDIFKSLKGAGFDMRPVFCGNAEPIQQEREQWLSGNNFFAIAPGKILGYACNKYTMEALSRAGYEVRRDEDFLTQGDSIDRYKKLVIGISGVELARGGGGARCMTMPVRRQPL